jgi:hypothetical protein
MSLMSPNLRARPSSGGLALALMLIGGAVIAVFTGLALGLGAYVLVAPVAALLPAVFLLVRPEICLIAVTGLTLLVAGLLKYFFGLGQFQWLLSGLGVMLLLMALVRTMFSGARVKTSPSGIEGLMFVWWLVLFFSSLANLVPILGWFVGIRIYLPFVGVFAYIAFCRPSDRLLKALFFFLMFIASVQWAFCLYQKFVIVPQRIAGGYPGSPWDSVVGTFGGEMFGGGESGSLGVFLAITLSIAAALHKSKMLGGFAFSAIMVFGLAAVGLSESKVVVLLVPLGALIVYHDYLFRNPVRFLMGGLLMVAFVMGLLVFYHFVYWEQGSRLGVVDSIIQRLSYSFDPNFRVTTLNLGRIGSQVFWWNSHSILDNPLTFLVGHGLASAVSQSSVIGMGSAVREYGYLLDTTGATKLLWESGLLGLMLFLTMFVVGFFRAYRLSRLASIPPWHRAVLSGSQAAMVLMFLAVFYEVTTVSSPPMQFINMLLMGYIVYWWRETGGGRT